jgi:hypothetical protein
MYPGSEPSEDTRQRAPEDRQRTLEDRRKTAGRPPEDGRKAFETAQAAVTAALISSAKPSATSRSATTSGP